MTAARIPFTTAEEGVITQLASWTLFIAIAHFIIGGLALLGSCGISVGAFGLFSGAAGYAVVLLLQALLTVATGGLVVFQGVQLLGVRTDLTKVVETDSNDQGHLSSAFTKLKMFFLLELVAFALAAVLALLGIVGALVAPEGMVPGNLGGMGGMSPAADFGADDTGEWE